MARKRADARDDWPAYLAQNDSGVFYYRHPRFMRQKANLGKNERVALAQARKLAQRFTEMERSDQAELFQTLATSAPPFNDQMEAFTEYWIVERTLRESTTRGLRQRAARLAERIGPQPVNMITSPELHKALKDHSPFEYGKARGHLVNFFKWARARGEYPGMAPNPAEQLLTRRLPQKVRARMTLEQFRKIYAKAPEWMKDMMVLCLFTTLRRSDLLALRFDQFEGEHVQVKIAKSDSVHRAGGPAYLRIWLPESVRHRVALAATRAQKFQPPCPFVIHRRMARSPKKEHFAQLLPHWVSQQFKRVRAEAEIVVEPGTNPPTLHEIRALSSHLLKKAGNDQSAIQALMAHTDEAQTAWYQSGHEITYQTVRLDLDVAI